MSDHTETVVCWLAYGLVLPGLFVLLAVYSIRVVREAFKEEYEAHQKKKKKKTHDR